MGEGKGCAAVCLLSRIDGDVDVVVVVQSDEREVASGRDRWRDGAVPTRDRKAARLAQLDQVRAACLVYDPLWLGLRTKNRAPDEKRIRVGFSKKEENEWGQWGMGEIAHVGCVSPEVGVDGAR